MVSRDKQKKAQELLLQSWAVVEKDLKQKRLDQQTKQLALLPTTDESSDDAKTINSSIISDPSTITTNNNNNPPPQPPPHQHQPPLSQRQQNRVAAAALLVQSVLRGHAVRRVLSAYYAQRTIRIFDPNAGR